LAVFHACVTSVPGEAGTLSGREEFVGGFVECGKIRGRVTGWIEPQGTFIPGVPGSASSTYEGEFTIRGTGDDDDDECRDDDDDECRDDDDDKERD
jgi:hypothetical protein